jgi:acyl-CoA synthetase (AMP-forming)/AMP-acid ligase II
MASLATTIAQTFDQRAAATALLVDGKSYSFRSLRQRAAGAAAVLQRRRIEPGDRVAVGLTNSLDLVVTVLGVLHSGAVLVPLNPASAADEIEYIVRDAQPRAAIVGPSHASILSSGRFLGLSWVDTTLAADPVSIPSEPADLPARAAAMIIYTSGTTGRPKGAVLSHAALLSNLTTVARAWHWTGACC